MFSIQKQYLRSRFLNYTYIDTVQICDLLLRKKCFSENELLSSLAAVIC